MAGPPRDRLLVVLLVAVVTVPLAVGGSAALSPTAGGDSAHGESAVSGQPPQVTPTNDSTVHHRDPESVREFGNIFRLRSWLSNALVDRVIVSSIELEQGEYEAARSLVGDRYDDRLDQFVDVIGDTYTDDDDDDDDTFREVQRTQRNLTRTVETYEQTYDEYERAVENGNRTRARQKARTLSDAADRVRRYNETLVRDYQRLANQTGRPLDATIERVSTVAENVSRRQSAVEASLFTETELRVEADRTRISFTDPLTASGRLVTADGAPVANRTITVSVYTTEQTVRTDEFGRFDLSYRPRVVPVTRSSLNVTYRPDTDSEYRASNTTVDVTIEQVEGRLTVTADPDTVTYDDRVTVSTTLTVDGEPVANVPVRAAADRFDLGSTPLDEAGAATFRGRLPATVPAGPQQLTVRAGNASTAVTAPNATATLSVEATATTLSVERESVSADRVRVSGRLATDDGSPAANQPIQLRIDDDTSVTAVTGPDGRYSTAFQREGLATAADETVSVTAEYDGTGRNLDSARATRRIDVIVDGAGDAGPGGDDSDDGVLGGAVPGGILPGSGGPDIMGVALVAGLFVVLVALVVARRSLAPDASDTVSGESDSTSGDATDDAIPGPTADSAAASADGATAGLEMGPGWSFLEAGDEAAAIQYTYQDLRGTLAGSFGVAEANTHWEFYNACRDGGMETAQLQALRSVVEAYETVTFGEDPSVADPDAVLEAVDAQW